MDETTLMLLQGVSTGAQAFTAYNQGRAAEQAAKENAAIAAAEGRRARQVAEEEAAEARREGRRLQARQKVLYAKSGVRAGTGTPLSISQYTQRETERRARILSEQGLYAEQYGLSRAAAFRREGRRASRNAMWKVGTSLLTGASTMGQMYKKWHPNE